MKQLLTPLFLLFSLTIFAQTTVVTGPKKKPQTTTTAKANPKDSQKKKPANTSEIKRKKQAQHGQSNSPHENFNISVHGNTIDTDVHLWSVVSVQGTSSRTIINKRCVPKSSPTAIWSDNNEFIEDCDTGKRYYLIDSEIGVGASNRTVLSNSNSFTYKEYYPKLPSSVTRINISSGSTYYARNVRIR